MLASSLETQSTLRSRWAEARQLTDRLLALVRPDAIYDRPIPERHRLVFYLGHLEAFDRNLLGDHALNLKSLHPQFDRLFAFGIDPVGGGLPTDQPSDWPAVAEIEAYNQRVREQLDAGVQAEFGSPALRDGTLLNVATEHRLMHAETLAYMLHQLPFDRKLAPRSPAPSAAPPVVPQMIEIPAGTVTLGLARREGGAFGWDNEFEAHTVEVAAFAIDAYKVTNDEYLKFVRAGGYEQRSLWPEADWNWIESQGLRHPRFWVRRGEDWFYRTMFAEIPLPADWPVYVSHTEAEAYARWVGKSLPTEAEWHRAAYGGPDGSEREYPWGQAPPEARHGNFDFHHWDPTPVGTYPAGRSAFGVCDLLGNGWEWTSTVFAAFPGFQPFSFYRGYSADFFDGRHYVMKGGSSRTAACMLRRSFRNWFQHHYPYAYAAFRCVSR